MKKFYQALKNTLPFILVLCSMMNVSAQMDPLYNLYSFNQFMINPAYAGIYQNFSANLVARQQWAGVPGAPETNALSIHSSLTDRFGTGLLVINDQFGVNTTVESQLAFSYKVISEPGKVLSMGVQGGVMNYRYDYTKLNPEYMNDSDIDFTKTNLTRPNFGGGLFYMTDSYYFSFSVPRILNFNITDGFTTSSRYSRTFYVGGGYVFNHNAKNSVKLKTTFLLRHTMSATLLDLGVSALFLDAVWAGVILRNFNAVALTTQFQVSNTFRVGYSFELPANSLIRTTYGTHELSLLLDLSLLKRHRKVVRYF